MKVNCSKRSKLGFWDLLTGWVAHFVEQKPLVGTDVDLLDVVKRAPLSSHRFPKIHITLCSIEIPYLWLLVSSNALVTSDALLLRMCLKCVSYHLPPPVLPRWSRWSR